MIPPVLRSAWARLLDLWKPMAGWSVAVWGLLAAVLTPVFATLLLAVPLVAGLFGVRELLLGAQDIHHYLYERPPRWWYAVGAGGRGPGSSGSCWPRLAVGWPSGRSWERPW